MARPTANPLQVSPMTGASAWKTDVSGTTAPRTKLGTVVVAVARRFVPNCSAATVTNTAQYPVENPSARHRA